MSFALPGIHVSTLSNSIFRLAKPMLAAPSSANHVKAATGKGSDRRTHSQGDHQHGHPVTQIGLIHAEQNDLIVLSRMLQLCLRKWCHDHFSA
jgi:hypothetical protein